MRKLTLLFIKCREFSVCAACSHARSLHDERRNATSTRCTVTWSRDDAWHPWNIPPREMNFSRSTRSLRFPSREICTSLLLLVNIRAVTVSRILKLLLYFETIKDVLTRENIWRMISVSWFWWLWTLNV